MTQYSRGMIVLASEQTWPNIHGLAYWHAISPGLSYLCIYYTNDQKRSLEPARRLAALCKAIYPAIRVDLPDKPLGIQPADVASQIRSWFQQYPVSEWILNATGGNKPMMAGMLRMVGEPNVRVVYRELQGIWSEFVRASDGRDLELRNLDVPRDATDAIPVEKLIETQYPAPSGARFTAVKPERLPVLKITEAGISSGWDWRLAFTGIAGTEGFKSGFLFEKYIGAVVLEMGVTNVAINLTLMSNDGVPLHEIDLAVNSKGNVLLIDCKLTNEEFEEVGMEEPITSQIRQAVATREKLGGLGATYLMLRPGRVFSAPERALAESSRIEVIDALASETLFDRLRTLLGIAKLPPELEKAANLLREARSNGATRIFAKEHFLLSMTRDSSAGQGIVHLEQLMAQRNQDWIAYYVDGLIQFKSRIPKGIGLQDFKRVVADRLAGYGKLMSFKRSGSGASCSFSLQPSKGMAARLSVYLEKYLGGSLFSDAVNTVVRQAPTVRERSRCGRIKQIR